MNIYRNFRGIDCTERVYHLLEGWSEKRLITAFGKTRWFRDGFALHLLEALNNIELFTKARL